MGKILNGGYHKPLPRRNPAEEARQLQALHYQRTGVDIGAWPEWSPEQHMQAIREHAATFLRAPAREVGS